MTPFNMGGSQERMYFVMIGRLLAGLQKLNVKRNKVEILVCNGLFYFG